MREVIGCERRVTRWKLCDVMEVWDVMDVMGRARTCGV